MKSKLSTITGVFSRMPEMSEFEKRNSSVLIVDTDQGARDTLRQSLIGQGYGGVSDAKSHLAALEKLQQRNFTHLIFEAKNNDMPANEFMMRAHELDESLISIASSADPSIDDVFGLLILGARGYIVKPISLGAVDDAIVMATKGEPISDAILYAKDRNEALASLIMTALDKLATILRQAKKFDTAQLEVPRAVMRLRRATDIARTFAKGGDDELLNALVEFALERSKGPATRLGRLRKRLSTQKNRPATSVVADGSGEQEAPSEGAAEQAEGTAVPADNSVEASGT